MVIYAAAHLEKTESGGLRRGCYSQSRVVISDFTARHKFNSDYSRE
jgi:hypothetical protein